MPSSFLSLRYVGWGPKPSQAMFREVGWYKSLESGRWVFQLVAVDPQLVILSSLGLSLLVYKMETLPTSYRYCKNWVIWLCWRSEQSIYVLPVDNSHAPPLSLSHPSSALNTQGDLGSLQLGLRAIGSSTSCSIWARNKCSHGVKPLNFRSFCFFCFFF